MLQMIQGAISGLMGSDQTPDVNTTLAPLTAVEQGSSAGSITDLSFPSDLGTQALYIKFDAVRRLKGRRTQKVIENNIVSIFLPLPPSLGDKMQSNYTQEGVGLFGEMGRELGEKFKDIDLSKITLAEVQNIAEGSAKYQAIKLSTNPTAAAGIIAGVLGAGAPGAAMIAGVTNAARGALVGEGIAINPYLTQIFTGVNLKSHEFTFKLMPKSVDESDKLKQIIRQFKQNMLPRIGSESGLAKHLNITFGSDSKMVSSAQKRMLFTYPNEWNIGFSPNVAKNLYMIKPCVLTNVQVEYHGEGKAFYFRPINAGGAHPLSVSVSLSFMETEIFTQEDIEAGNGEAAVATPEQPGGRRRLSPSETPVSDALGTPF